VEGAEWGCVYGVLGIKNLYVKRWQEKILAKSIKRIPALTDKYNARMALYFNGLM
jgi:hypothetical protein